MTTHTERCPVAPHAHLSDDHVRTYWPASDKVESIDLWWSQSIGRWVTIPDDEGDAFPPREEGGNVRHCTSEEEAENVARQTGDPCTYPLPPISKEK
jgi:hypothetical protein